MGKEKFLTKPIPADYDAFLFAKLIFVPLNDFCVLKDQ